MKRPHISLIVVPKDGSRSKSSYDLSVNLRLKASLISPRDSGVLAAAVNCSIFLASSELDHAEESFRIESQVLRAVCVLKLPTPTWKPVHISRGL